MATTDVGLYRSVMGNKFHEINIGEFPGEGILDPRWQPETYFSKKLNKNVINRADVVVETGKDGLPEVLEGGGTSLHDVSGWFRGKEFWLPEGTEYSSDVIILRKDAKLKRSEQTNVEGRHYQLEPKTRMTVAAFKGALDNMARAAVARQCQVARNPAHQ